MGTQNTKLYRIRIQVIAQAALVVVALLFNYLAKSSETARFLESFRPGLQRLFYANEREEFSKVLFTLHEAIQGAVVAHSLDGTLLVDFGSRPFLSAKHSVTLGLTPGSADASIAFYTGWVSFDPLHCFAWLILALGLFAFLNILFKEQNRRHQSDIQIERFSAVALTVAGLVHDIRRPFALVSVLLDTLKSLDSKVELLALVARGAPEIKRAAQGVESMLNDVLSISRGDSDRAIALTEQSIQQVFHGSLVTVLQSAKGHDFAIETEIATDLCLMIDVDRISRVLGNLIWNAVQAMDSHGKLILRAKAAQINSSHWIEVAVANTGSYIPPESQTRLFDAFFTKGKEGGTGLGLAIAKRWVEAHGGTISCRSVKNPNFPTGYVEFVMTLPAAPANRNLGVPQLHKRSRQYAVSATSGTGDVQVAVEESRRGGQLRVAFVDDSLVMRLSWKAALGNHVALTLFKFPREIQSSGMDFDVIVTDMRFDTTSDDGVTVARWARSELPAAKVIVCSADNQVDMSYFDGSIEKERLPTLAWIESLNS
jgi:signal transduction histidine kinase